MPTYRIRLVCQAGRDFIGGTTLEYEEETVEVAATSLWDAKGVAVRRMTLIPQGRLLRFFDADTGYPITPPPLAPLREGQFVIDGLPGTYQGFTRGETWNGFAVPYFPSEEARRIASDFTAQPASLDGDYDGQYDPEREVVLLFDPSVGEWDEYEPVEIGGMALYPVGTRYWTWEEV